MNDDHKPEDRQVKDAYARLGTALRPPPDVAVRVEHEVGARRRRRRVTAVGAALVLAAGVTSGAVLLGGDDAGHDDVATDPGSPHGTFTLTRQDGSSVTFDDFTLSCETTPLGGPSDSGTVNLWSPFHLDESREELTEPYVYISVAVDQFDGRTVHLPYEDSDQETGVQPLIVFAAEADGPGEKRPNEVSSAQPGARGTVHVVRASCDPTPVLEIEVETTLGSEVEQATEQLVGSYR
jgi:hypothetical protein